MPEVLPRSFYERPTLEVARALLGQTLVYRQQRCRIVETEAYWGPDDRASHAGQGRTKRSEIMFGPAGYAYIYIIYGMHHCLNIVTEEEGFPAAILIRAAEPLGRGPGVLCRELGLTREQNGADVTGGSELRVEPGPPVEEQVLTSPRIGVDYAGEWALKPWRFYLNGNPWVSKLRRTATPGKASKKDEGYA